MTGQMRYIKPAINGRRRTAVVGGAREERKESRGGVNSLQLVRSGERGGSTSEVVIRGLMSSP